MSSSSNLKGEIRDKVGSRSSRALRSESRIPCTIQADKDHEHLNFHLDQAEFLTSRRQHTHLYDLEMGGKTHSAVVRELQYDALGSDIIHVEFKPVTRGVATESDVELSFVGAVTDGVLNQSVSHITISSLPSLIPDEIEVRVGGLAAGTHIVASQLNLPEGVELAIDPDTEIAVISAIRAEAETPEEGEETEGDAATEE